MRGLPSGTVTFLFTDIERSTQTVAALGDENYADVQDAHRKLLRESFMRHDGVEVGTEGDAFFVAFQRAGDAVAAAADGQRAIEGYAWPREARIRVRIGLHTGEAAVREGSYVGHDVHKAKRICDAGHGGQVLLSQTTADLVSSHSSVVDLGPHRLKDLGEPQRLFQLSDDRLAKDFPPLRSIEAFTHNLPVQRTTFVGRSSEIAQLQDMLARERLVTLTGVGGIGKTRLALQTGAEQLDVYPDGVFFIDLAPIAEPDAIAQVIAEAVGLGAARDVEGGAQGSTVDRVLAHFATRKSLLILDNCEHLLDAAAELSDHILSSCPDVTILATSREALDIEGEQAWRLPSLTLPETGAQGSEAVSLFKARARAVRVDFDLTPSNVDDVVQICRRLDGIPLAIELAASRVSHMSPNEIVVRLGDMFQLLAGSRRRRVQRQQTLQAALDWSHGLLDDDERTLFRRLGVFAGSFSLAAVEGVCCIEGLAPRRMLDLLGSLVAKSLVGAEDLAGETRYRLMETVRLYAGEKLHDAGEAETFRDRHVEWYGARVLELPNWSEAGMEAGYAFAADYPNLAIALERYEEAGRLDLVMRIATRLMPVFVSFGYFEAAYRWLSVARPEDVDIPKEDRVSVLEQLSYLVNALQKPGSLEFAERAIDATEGEPMVPAIRAYGQRAFALAIRSEALRDPELAAEARRTAAELARIAEMLPSDFAALSAKVYPATVELILGDYAAAHAALSKLPSGRVPPIEGTIAAHLSGAHAYAAELVRSSTSHHDKVRERRTAHFGLGVWTGILQAVGLAGAGDLDGARSMFRDRFEDAKAAHRQGLEVAIVVGAVIAYWEGDLPCASRLLSWARARTLDRGRIMASQGMYALYKYYARALRDALPPEEADRYRSEGTALSEEEASSLVLRTEERD